MTAASERLTLAEVAGIISDRRGKRVSVETVRRLVKNGALAAERERWPGGKRYLVERSQVERHLLLEWFDQQMRSFVLRDPSSPSPKEDFPVHFRIGPYEDGQRPPKYEIRVSLDEFWRFAYQRSDAAVKELRCKANAHEGTFEVRFILDQQEVRETLMQLVRRVRPPRVFGTSREELQAEAVGHLILKALPRFRSVVNDPTRYLLRATKHFYLDKLRQARRSREIPFEAAGDLAPED